MFNAQYMYGAIPQRTRFMQSLFPGHFALHLTLDLAVLPCRYHFRKAVIHNKLSWIHLIKAILVQTFIGDLCSKINGSF